ncbi:MAG: hypothetical protein D6812_13545 [Deltaproteobacteria bacterium]|nr:MAG: hypothetical protein D6812_13545 [Deltaproteobacteria bacterium]
MKRHFEPDLDDQLAAIEAVGDLFRGREICRTEFTVTRESADSGFLPGMENNLGLGNHYPGQRWHRGATGSEQGVKES